MTRVNTCSKLIKKYWATSMSTVKLSLLLNLNKHLPTWIWYNSLFLEHSYDIVWNWDQKWVLRFTDVHKDSSSEYFDKFLSKHNWWSPMLIKSHYWASNTSRQQLQFICIWDFTNHQLNVKSDNSHCVKIVHIRRFSDPYSVRMPKNTDQKNFEYRYFSRCEY